MKILWVTNTIFPDVSKHLGLNTPVVGGWMYGLAKDIASNGISLVVATARQGISNFSGEINGISYVILEGSKPITEYDVSLEEAWKEVVSEVKPDIVHIHGSEYAHGLSLVNACPNLQYVISIQGLISVYARYYTGQITPSDIRRSYTLRDFLKRDSILQAQRKFTQRGEKIEKTYFKKVAHFIGRTQWDHDHVKTLNPEATYHFCNESLRDSFYDSRKWSLQQKREHTIFLSQANYPIKGLHQVIKAVSLLKTKFPSIKIRVAGSNIIASDNFKKRLKMHGYGKYVFNLIRSLQLENHIEFTGLLDETQMVEAYLNCHAFICPSSIENSPNSLGEAQLLGVPCIASFVGGVPNMVQHEKTGMLYRYEEVEMLAQAISRIFTDDGLAQSLSENGHKVAKDRHNRVNNMKKNIEIYNTILQTA